MAQAAEQGGRTKPIFEQADLPADRAMGHAKFRRRLAEVAAAGRSLEGADGVERRKGSTLGWGGHDVSFADFGTANKWFAPKLSLFKPANDENSANP